MGNKNMNEAKKKQNDEFYTLYEDIEKEVSNYKKCLKGKVVYCNADDPEHSNFWKYFYSNFRELGLKGLSASCYKGKGYGYVYSYDGKNLSKVKLKSNGDFRSSELRQVLRASDVVITNPPFSLFREYILLLLELNKKFLVIGNMNAITYKEVFPLIKNADIWLGINSPKDFIQPDKTLKRFGNILWFTNLEHEKKQDLIPLVKTYQGNESEYPFYDNYNAIEVSRVANIPKDYDGIMGVPITFLTKYNAEQFEILGSRRWAKSEELLKAYTGNIIPPKNDKKVLINGKEVYDRIFIQRK